MKTYTFWYNETHTYKGGFHAKSLEEAKELLRKAFNNDIDMNDLPDFWYKDKGYDFELAPETIEEWDE